jgi:hypothetical protein
MNADEIGVHLRFDDSERRTVVYSSQAFQHKQRIGWLWGALHACQTGCAPQQGVPLPAAVRGCSFLVGHPQCPLTHCRVALPLKLCNARVQPRSDGSGAFDPDALDSFRYWEVVASQDIAQGTEIFLALQPCRCDGMTPAPRARGGAATRALGELNESEAATPRPRSRAGSSSARSAGGSGSSSSASSVVTEAMQRRASLTADGALLRVVQPHDGQPEPYPYFCCTRKCCENEELQKGYICQIRFVAQ